MAFSLKIKEKVTINLKFRWIPIYIWQNKIIIKIEIKSLIKKDRINFTNKNLTKDRIILK